MYLKALNMLPSGNRYDGQNERRGGDSREEEECSVITLLSTNRALGSDSQTTEKEEGSHSGVRQTRFWCNNVKSEINRVCLIPFVDL